jgi:hypothetical protein
MDRILEIFPQVNAEQKTRRLGDGSRSELAFLYTPQLVEW